MRVCVVGLLLGLAIAACSRDPITEKPPRPRGIGPVTAETEQPRANTSSEQTLVVQAPRPDLPALPPTAAAPEPEAKPPRDFSAELLQALGSPAACLKPRTSETAPASIDIMFATSVMPSGAVAQSEVRGAGLDPSETTCLRNRLETLHFAVPIENAPIKVSASMHLSRANAIAPALGAERDKKQEVQAYVAPAAVPAVQPGASDLSLGNPEVGAPPLNAPNPP